jgi:hypothetical protein
MKLRYFLLVLVTLGVNICYGQTNGKEFYSKDFNWHITIPQGFESVSAEEWAKMQNKGADAIEKTIDGKVENNAKIIFVFKSDKFNYFEANYQPFDAATDGDYLTSCRNVDKVVYETFSQQMPGMKIDTATTTENIDGLSFHQYTIKIRLPNDMVLNMLMFNRLFDKKEFTVNIMYLDKARGQQMLTAWKSSRFH